jgi:mRNA interferase MazF
VGRVRPPLVRGDVWDAEFDPVRGREQAGRRPAVVVSIDLFNQGPGQLVAVLPLTSRDRRVRWHVSVQPPEGGLVVPSFAMCDQLRVVSVERLLRRRGEVGVDTLTRIEDRLRVLLDL